MKDLNLLEKSIGYQFKNKELLKDAFVHRSYLNENKDRNLISNEKLEFLGDSVLSLITSIYLYQKYPELSEGAYTDIKASIVRTDSLYSAAQKLNLGRYLFLSKGEAGSDGRNNISILADCFEALIAAIFLDEDFGAAYQFVNQYLFAQRLDAIIRDNRYSSAKNKLQEYWQNKYKTLPVYRVLQASGPEHSKNYIIGVFNRQTLLAKAEGSSKKTAEEKAASIALQNLGV